MNTNASMVQHLILHTRYSLLFNWKNFLVGAVVGAVLYSAPCRFSYADEVLPKLSTAQQPAVPDAEAQDVERRLQEFKASPPSANYAGRIVARIKPNIVYRIADKKSADVRIAAEVEVKTASDGTILQKRLVKASGNDEWDEAVLNAIDRTKQLPLDANGRIPPVIVIRFRPYD